MNKNDIIKMIEEKIEKKIKEHKAIWTGHLNQNIITKRTMLEGEIKALKELRKELNMKHGNVELVDPFPLVDYKKYEPTTKKEGTTIYQVFIMPESMNGDALEEDRLTIFYNKETTDYHVKYKDDIIFNTESDKYYHFRDTGKTWRYRKLYNRIELSRGLEMISYKIMDNVTYSNYYPKFKKIYVSQFLRHFVNWLFINEIPKEDRDHKWKEKVKLLEKEGN